MDALCYPDRADQPGFGASEPSTYDQSQLRRQEGYGFRTKRAAQQNGLRGLQRGWHVGQSWSAGDGIEVRS
jgi:hypothetical protein